MLCPSPAGLGEERVIKTPLFFPEHFPRESCRLVEVQLGMGRKTCWVARFMSKQTLKNDLPDCTDGEPVTRLRPSLETEAWERQGMAPRGQIQARYLGLRLFDPELKAYLEPLS